MNIPFETSVSITRSTAGSYNTLGKWIAGGTSIISIQATILPEKNIELIAQLGGTNNSGMMTIRSVSEIIAANETGSVVGDKFNFDGRDYEVIRINKYTQVIPHYKGRAKEIDDREGIA